MLTFSSKPYIYDAFIFFWFCLNIFIEGDAEIVTLYPMVHDYMQVQILVLDHMYLLSFAKFHIYEHLFMVLAANGIAGVIYSINDLMVMVFVGEPFTVAVYLAFLYHITHAFAEGIESYIRMRTQIWHHQLSDFSCEVIRLKLPFLGVAYNIPDISQGFIGEQSFFKTPSYVHLTDRFRCQKFVSLVIHFHND